MASPSKHACDIFRHVAKLLSWRLRLRPYDAAAKTPDDKFFLCYFFSNLPFSRLTYKLVYIDAQRMPKVGWLCWGLTSQSTIFQSYRDGAIASWVINQYFRGVKCLAQGHNTAAVGLEPRTSRSGVRHSTTEPPRSPNDIIKVLFIVVFFVLLIIDYSTKKDVLVYSRKCAREIEYFRSNPYIKQCELMCWQILLHFNFHVNLGDKRSGMISFYAWKSRVRIPHWYSVSLSSVILFSITTARQSIFHYSLLMKILICDYIICDRPFSHMGQEYPFLWLSEIFLSRPASLILGQTCCPKLSIIAIWAASWQNQQNGMCAQRRLRSAQSDQSSLSAWRKLGSFASIPNSKLIHFSVYIITYNYMRCNTISYPLNAQRRLWSVWADAQTDLSLGWAHSHFVGFGHFEAAHI